jgi:alkylation response protein AidB-like acyl-CoA dehydrogenase
VVRTVGLEPTASAFAGPRSIQLSYERNSRASHYRTRQLSILDLLSLLVNCSFSSKKKLYSFDILCFRGFDMTELKIKKSYSDPISFLDACLLIAPEITSRTNEITEKRQIPKEIINLMVEHGLFRLMVPKSIGGHEIDYLEFLKLVSTIGYADASVAWCFNQNNILAYNSGFMHKELAQKIWNDDHAILSNGQTRNAVAVPSESGYILNGRWDFSSGSRHANWTIAIAPVQGTKEIRNTFLPNSDVEWFDTWQVSGLRGTGSYSFELKDKYIDKENTYIDAGEPMENGPLYLMPKNLLFCSGFATVALSAARASIDSIIKIAGTRTPQNQQKLINQPYTQREIAQAEAIWRSANAFLNESAAEVWDSLVTERHVSDSRRINLRLASTHAIRESLRVADIVYTLSGSTAIFEQTPIQRKSQDIRAISQQVQGRMTHYDTAGKFFLGLDPGSKGSF